MVRINVTVKTNAKKTRIARVDGDDYKIELKAPAENGKANLELIKILHRKTKKKVRIISGKTSKKKVVELSS